MDRRSLLRAVLVLGGGSMMPELGSGGGLDVTAEGARTAEFKAAYRLGEPGALLALETRAYQLKDAWRALRSSSDHFDAGRLFADAAQWLAHIHYKGANYLQGAWWANQAQGVAEKTRDRQMVTVAICRKSIIRAAEGKPGHAAQLAETAKRFKAGPWADGLAETHLAYAYAKSPELLYDTLSAMDRAEVAFDRALADGTPPPMDSLEDELRWLDYHRGNMLVRTDPTRAESYLVRMLNGLPEDRRLTKGAIQIRRAEVATSLRHYEQTVRLVKEGLAIAAESNVTREINRVMRLRNTLGETAPARLVKELDEALQPHRDVRGSVLWRHDARR
jgi:hypothetical protein